MNPYFPRHTREQNVAELPGFNRLTLSLAEMALITGVTIRLLRAVAATNADSYSWFYIASAIALGAVVLFGMAALHMANYTMREWVWRAPAFAICEAAAEMTVSAILIVLGREPVGSGRAGLDQWWALASTTFVNRTLAVCLFAAALAGVVHIVRRVVISGKSDRREAAILRAELLSDAPEPEIDRSNVS
jgi:hypothetical protein